MPNRVKELHNIMPISNIQSVLKHGILSHSRASDLLHDDISLNDVQIKRKNKQVPNGLKLHEYASLYFCAHNPMLSKRRDQNENICILQISKKVLLKQGVILTDQNAASNYVSFYPSPIGLHQIDFDRVYSEFWTHPDDQIEQWRHSSIKCAEILVPNCIETVYIEGAYVVNQIARDKLIDGGFLKPITIKEDMFF